MIEEPPVVGVVGLGAVGEALLGMLRDAGHDVVGVDTDPEVLARVERRLAARSRQSTPHQAGSGRSGATAGNGQGGTVVLSEKAVELAGAAIVIEAVPEDWARKIAVLRQIHTACPAGTAVATTTRSLSLPWLAVAAGRPDTTLGLRLLSPPAPGGPVQPVHTAMTSPGTVAAVEALVTGVGLRRVTVDARSAAAATTLVYGLLNRAVALYEQQIASRDDIDTALRLGCGLPIGPLELLDRIGLDTVHGVLTRRHDQAGDPRFAPAPLLTALVAAGRVGRKAGGGIYEYGADGSPVRAQRPDVGPRQTTGAVRRLGLLGSGTMARGIAEAASTAGFPTVLVTRSEAAAGRALAAIENALAARVARGRLSQAAAAEAMGLLDASQDLAALHDCDLVIEATVEDLAVKQAMFARLGAACRPDAVLATTTSSLSVTACAEPAGRPGQVVGLHFFNPVPAMKLVELASTEATRDDVVATAQAFCAQLGKTTVSCLDRPGFIVNVLLLPYLGDALRLLERPDISIEGIDSAIEQGFGYPMGPFTLIDTIGLDVCLAVQRQLHAAYGAPDFAPSPLLEQMVANGWLGRKNQTGLQSARWAG